MTGTVAAGEELPSILTALNDPTCREILECLDEPTSAESLATRCGVSSSTVYRKLEALQQADLVERRYYIQSDYSQTTRYATTFDEITISVDDVQTVRLATDG